MSTYTDDTGNKEAQFKIYTLGDYLVFKEGKQLLVKSSKIGKPWELFAYLISHPDKKIPAEIIHEDIWPGGENPDPVRRIKNSVHRLRKIIDNYEGKNGESTIIYSNGCYSLNRNVSCWLDILAFEDLCSKAYYLSNNNPSSAVKKFLEALSLYRGDFLPGLSLNDWVIPLRNYYRQLFVRSVIELIEIYKKANNFSEIAKICEKTFLVEQYEEALHLSYLEALIEQGKIAQARGHYQYITSLFYREFGTKPSNAMLRFYRSLKTKISRPELTFSDIRYILSERDNINGAMLCDLDTFELICSLEKRRAVRHSTLLFIATLTLTGPDFQLPPTEALFAAMEKLKEVFLYNLRKGDVFHQWNESQYVVLLSAMDQEHAEAVIKRISKKLDKGFTKNLIIPRSTIYPLVF